MSYSIDTSALMDAWQRWYPADIFPAVWSHLDHLAADGQIHSSEEVLREVAKKDDDLHKWAKERRHVFLPLTRTGRRYRTCAFDLVCVT